MKEAYKEYAKYGGKKAAIFPYDWLIYESHVNSDKFEGSEDQKQKVPSS